jgi:F0F1-type ATP synthase membrane subunit c/vacuolar-type H+-ATPase subunit K
VFAAAAVGAFAVDDGALGWTERTRTAAAGVASAAVVVLVPFVLGGGLPQLFDQVVVTPLVVSDGGGVIGNFRSLLDAFGSTWIVPVLGLFGVGSVLARADSPETNPRLAVLVAPVGWFVLVALVDFDGFADAIPLAFLSGLGAGVYVGQSLTAVSRLPRDRRLGVVLAVLVVGSAVLALPWVERSDPDVGAGPAEQFGNAYLNGVEFHVCHVRLSSVERDWIRRYGADRSARRCPVSWLSGDPG